MGLLKYISIFIIFFVLQFIFYTFIKTEANVSILSILGVSIIFTFILYFWDLFSKSINKSDHK